MSFTETIISELYDQKLLSNIRFIYLTDCWRNQKKSLLQNLTIVLIYRQQSCCLSSLPVAITTIYSRKTSLVYYSSKINFPITVTVGYFDLFTNYRLSFGAQCTSIARISRTRSIYGQPAKKICSYSHTKKSFS